MRNPARSVLAASCLAVFVSGLPACSDDDDRELVPPAEGANFVVSRSDNPGTFNALDMALQGNPNISVVARVDHEQNAASVDLQLRPTREIFFGNPQLGTPLMQSNQVVGIDLPQKFIVIDDAAGRTLIGWNDADYLQARHNLQGVDEQLGMIDNALRMLATGVASNDEVSGNPVAVTSGEGLVEVVSESDFSTTVNRLRAAINGNDQLTLVVEFDHQQNASTVGMSLPPTTLFVFGNPAAGTPLMQAEQGTAVDLPQKMLVYQDRQAIVRVVYNAPAYVASRHSIRGQNSRLSAIANALATLAGQAANGDSEG